MTTRRKFLFGSAVGILSAASTNAAVPRIPPEVKALAEKLRFKIRVVYRAGMYQFRLDIPGDDKFFTTVWHLYFFCKGVDWQRNRGPEI